MDLRRLSRAMSSGPRTHPNGTTEPISLTDLPPNILDALIPGYSLISRYILAALGVDISLFVSLAAIALAATKGGQFLYARLSHLFRQLFVSSVYIHEGDDIFDNMVDWIATVQTSSSNRAVRARTQRAHKTGEDVDDVAAVDALSDDGFFDFTKWAARVPPRYEPYYGRHWFWHRNRLFTYRRTHKENPGNNLLVSLTGSGNDHDRLQIDTLGRSVEPIKHLLADVKVWSLKKQRNTTTIKHPTPKESRRGGVWSRTFARPSRPMDTVILDQEQKDMIVRDMNEYLHPSSAKWYATRGIPYRRGYLFHGAPGTGKTSLSFALAGIFGLGIFVIGLQEPNLTEGELMQLFSALPKRCVVLLEDVDAAGLVNREDKENEGTGKGGKRKGGRGKKGEQKESQGEEEKSEEEYTIRDLVREVKDIKASLSTTNNPPSKPAGQQTTQPKTDKTTGISLSGLLNAIDGVASHEGRVLIMTTNHPENLDPALIRPGRVDRKVEFKLAQREQVRELFLRMYAGTDAALPSSPSNGRVTANGSVMNGHLPDHKDVSGEKTLDTAELGQLAREFAGMVPDGRYTPAEIQNHLMRFKNEPRVAVARAGEWMRELEGEKKEVDVEEDGEGDAGES